MPNSPQQSSPTPPPAHQYGSELERRAAAEVCERFARESDEQSDERARRKEKGERERFTNQQRAWRWSHWSKMTFLSAACCFASFSQSPWRAMS
jgi:hypothetical protein